MEWITNYTKSIYNNIIGWLEITLHKEATYRCLIDNIELTNRQAIIHYKTIGCRSLQQDTASNLNKSTVFSLFRPDHAQIIVSIATVESLLGKSSEEIIEKFQQYVSYCAQKLAKGL